VAQLTMPRAKIVIKPKINKLFIKHPDLVLNYAVGQERNSCTMVFRLTSQRLCVTPIKMRIILYSLEVHA
jgi:hypothetical protein